VARSARAERTGEHQRYSNGQRFRQWHQDASP
jgi:hypothetical protein